MSKGQTELQGILKCGPPKNYIYQLHCNQGREPSLADYLSEGRGFVDNEIRDLAKNRVQIGQILRMF